ncbi:hypothetical protein ACEN2I_02005 [Flavobacterium sp. W22_SRS_FK3]|uniref:hypothetical protein n=1 Tax=Flavobacterium sp. W22_SRS_FK3 TaxID=3240275 RepID=UPI003F906739
MSEIQKLLAKKDGLLIEIACIVEDLNEYVNYPVETVSVDQLHYQYDFIIKEIVKINREINLEHIKHALSFHSQNVELKKLTEKATSSIVFTVKDLPKLHFSMFETPNLL